MGLSCRKKPRDAPPAYAGRPIENIRTLVMQGRYRGSGLVHWRTLPAARAAESC